MKFALIALLAISFAGCAGDLYTHHKDYSPMKGKGPWTDLSHDVHNGRHDDDPDKRPVFSREERSH